MATVDLKFLHKKSVKRNGKTYVYYYFRRGGLEIRLPPPTDAGFLPKYSECLKAPESKCELPYSIASLIKAYRQSPEFKSLAPRTRAVREVFLNLILSDHGDKHLGKLTRSKVFDIRDAMQDKPGKANNYISCLSVLMDYATKRDWRRDNPCAGVGRLELGEHEPWPDEVIQKAIGAADPVLRLAIALHYYTGQRITDVCKMTWHDIKDGTVRVVQQKTGKELWIKLHSDLAKMLGDAAINRDSIHILPTNWRTPFSPHSLRNRLRTLMAKIGENYVFHGLRKNAVNELLQAGCTTWEVSAITGQSPQMIEHYAKKVDRRSLAERAIGKWESGQTSGQTLLFTKSSDK